MRRLDGSTVLESAHDSWRAWLLTGVRRDPVDRRRIRGSHVGLKKMLVEGMNVRFDKPYSWKEFSDAMTRQSVGEAMHALAREDSQVVKLAYFGGLSNREIAGNMGLGEATVERKLRHALDVINHYIERGRGAGRNVIAAIGVWLSGRWLADALHGVAPVGAVAAATVIILANPVPAVTQAPAAAPSSTMTVSPPAPSPTTPVAQPSPPSLAGTTLQAPVAVPAVPNPTVHLPPLPSVPSPPPLPVKVKPPQL
jgi:DNA-directed RNA polymerase specialized sigma24 family protein